MCCFGVLHVLLPYADNQFSLFSSSISAHKNDPIKDLFLSPMFAHVLLFVCSPSSQRSEILTYSTDAPDSLRIRFNDAGLTVEAFPSLFCVWSVCQTRECLIFPCKMEIATFSPMLRFKWSVNNAANCLVSNNLLTSMQGSPIHVVFDMFLQREMGENWVSFVYIMFTMAQFKFLRIYM